jgi:diadenosine tetraphosphate (Ap4A) HIT family hydrolase
MFELDYRLEGDCVFIGSLSLCRILLMKDANFPWILLVPQRSDISEVYELDSDDQEQLIWESSFVAERLMDTFDGDKMNIAALGNVVPQLHIHHVVRTQTDPAWPNPVWGAVPARAYLTSDLDKRVALLRKAFVTSTFKIPE